MKILEKVHSCQDNKYINLLGKYCFCLGLFIEIAVLIIDKSAFINPFEGRMFQIAFVLFFLKLITTKYDIEEYAVIFLFCLLGLWVDITGERNEILRLFVFVAAAKGIDMKKCQKWIFYFTSSGCMLIVLLSVFGIFGSITVEKEYMGEGMVSRFSFGMGNANSFHIMIFVLILLGMYVYHNRMRYFDYLILLIIDIILYLMTDARTPFLMMAFSILVMAADRFWTKKSKRGIQRIFALISIGLSVFSVLISIVMAAIAKKVNYIYSVRKFSSPLYKIDLILTGRMRMLTDTDYWADISEWKIAADPSHVRFFDLGFVRLFYWYGIIPAAIILLVFFALIIWFYRNEKYTEISFLAIIAVFTIVEAHFVSVYIGRAYPFFILAAFWYQALPQRRVLTDSKHRAKEV